MRSSFCLVILLIGALSVASASAQNDTCNTAINISNGVTAGSNVGATTGPDPVTSNCGFNNGSDVWYSYTAPCNGVATAEFCNAGSATFDTVLTAWTGTCGNLVELTCNDDFCGLQSHIIFPVTLGTTYYLSVAGYNTINTGSFNLSLSCMAPAANDFCGGAVVLTAGVPVQGDNTTASTGPEPVVTACGGSNGPDMWYLFVPTCSGTYEATTCSPNTQTDTVLGVWDGTGGCGGLVAVACNDDDPTPCSTGGYFGLESRVSWLATGGTPYLISVAGFAGSTGPFEVVVNNLSGLTLNFLTGPNAIAYQISGGPGGSTAFTAVTLNAGSYPNAWFFGIDIGFAELIGEYNNFPFMANLAGTCGGATVGPFFGAPSGLTVYGATVILPLGGGPTIASNPATATVP